MKKTIIMVAAVLLGCGCAARQARETAGVLRQQLGNYRKSVETARQAENDFYEEAAAAAAQSQKNLAENSVIDARRTNSFRFTDSLVADPLRNVTTSALTDFLLASTDAEFDLVKQGAARREQARTEFLKGVQDLAALAKEVSIVEQELQALSETKKPLDSAREIGEFLQQTAKQVQAKLEERKKQ